MGRHNAERGMEIGAGSGLRELGNVTWDGLGFAWRYNRYFIVDTKNSPTKYVNFEDFPLPFKIVTQIKVYVYSVFCLSQKWFGSKSVFGYGIFTVIERCIFAMNPNAKYL